jgi:signal transduction histidine kinase
MRTLLLELRPSALLENDLSDLLPQLVLASSNRAKIQIELDLEQGIRLPDEVQIGFYRIAQEALNNVAKHAHANKASLSLQRLDSAGVRLVVQDNGRGFNPEYTPHGQLGLQIMRERAASLGLALNIYSKAGQGVKIVLEWHEL